MSATEIILIVIGAAVFLLGYLMPARKKDIDEEVQLISEDEVRRLIAGETENVKDKIADIVDETVNYSIEKAERAMERVTNEKIMAVNEYSDTVLEEINKNHKEVVFLYDMLNDKHDNLMSTINEATEAADEIRQTVKDAELTAAEAADKIDVVMQAADEAADMIKDAEDAAVQAQDAMRSVMKTAENTRSDLTLLHSARPYHEDVVEEAQEALQSEAKPAVLVREDAPLLADASEIIGEGNFVREADGMSGENNAGEQTEPDAQKDHEEFMPITPRRVEIVERLPEDDERDLPDRESMERDMSTSEAFASMGFFAPRPDAQKRPGRRTRSRRNPNRENEGEGAVPVDIQFDQEKDNGRNSNERILELHKAGKSNMAIAKELGLGLGEVKLVIDLFEGM